VNCWATCSFQELTTDQLDVSGRSTSPLLRRASPHSPHATSSHHAPPGSPAAARGRSPTVDEEAVAEVRRLLAQCVATRSSRTAQMRT